MRIVGDRAAGRRTGGLGLGFSVVADLQAEAIRAFGVLDEDNETAWPSIFIVGKDGTILKRWPPTRPASAWRPTTYCAISDIEAR